ncbi:MAG TPA: hypothetical protein VL947_04650 [Cytophagales bacterium]|nr:hypothetical protein [Cytophagales bacterium]
MLINRLGLALLFILTLVSCKKHLSPEEYVSWVKDKEHGLVRAKVVGDVKFEAMYKPVDYALVEQFKDSLGHPQAVERRRQDLINMVYIDLELSMKEGDVIESAASSVEEVQQVMYYYSFDFAKDLTLTTTTDTATCELFHFMRTYRVGNKRKFLLGFPKRKSFEKEDLTLNIDSDLLGVGNVKITYNKEDINNLPVLKK